MSQNADDQVEQTLGSKSDQLTVETDETEIDEQETRLDPEPENEEAEEDTSESDGASERAANDDPAKASVAATSPASSRRGQSARDGEPYEFDHCTTVIMLQIMPPRPGQEKGARKVFLSVRTHSDPPCSAYMRWSDLESRLPDEIKLLLSRVREEMPQRAAERAAAEEAERERQAQLKEQAEKRDAERKARAQTKASTTRPAKRGKVDLNAVPTLPASEVVAQPPPAQSPATANLIGAAPAENEPTQAGTPPVPASAPKAPTATAQMSLF